MENKELIEELKKVKEELQKKNLQEQDHNKKLHFKLTLLCVLSFFCMLLIMVNIIMLTVV